MLVVYENFPERLFEHGIPQEKNWGVSDILNYVYALESES